MKKPKISIGTRGVSRVVTALVFLVSGTLVALTAWFFMSTLAGVDRTRQGDTTRTARLDGIDGDKLDALLKLHAQRRTAAPPDPTGIANPFVGIAPVVPPSSVVPEPAVAPSPETQAAPVP